MTFQRICRAYQQNLQHTRAQSDATAELSLHPHLRTFLEKTAESLEHEITITSEPRTLEIGRPDFVVKSGLLPVGYIESGGYSRGTETLRLMEEIDEIVEEFLI